MGNHYNGNMNEPSELYKTSSFKQAISNQVSLAIAEDIGERDYTASLIEQSAEAKATIIVREDTLICGIPWVNECFKQINPSTQINWLVEEGDKVSANQVLCHIAGNARDMLSAERTALNFLQTLSATATITNQYVHETLGTNARIMDTRKTIPGLRLAQKYAVFIGGGLNQRIGLYDGILIKENHIAAAGGIQPALHAAKNLTKDKSLPIQIEVENLSELESAIESGATLILLDNFDIPTLKKAVKINQKRAILEASGGISINNIRDIANTGVDRISVGSLTKNIKAVDLSMRFE
jgi:nicotinate-nucleotide pyrophosphorylase (carboxylating)